MSEDQDKITDMIQCSSLGDGLEREACEVLSTAMDCVTLCDGEFLFKEGDSDECIYVLTTGRLAVVKGEPASSTILHVLEPGSMAGEMAFIDQTPHSASLKALGDTTVLQLDREKFEALIENHAHLTYEIMRSIVRCVHHTLKRMNSQYVEMANYITKTHGRY